MSEKLTTVYQFQFADGTQHEFAVELLCPTLAMLPPPLEGELEWIRLTFQQCPHCPLDPDQHPHCPVARNLVPLASAICDRSSCDEVDVTVRTPARSYQKRCSLQEGVSALMGLIMASSGCPYLDRLRPMVFTHLPFATGEQTTYRAVSMYLLAQYFRQRRGLAPDWDLTGLAQAYSDVRMVNMAFAERLAAIDHKDANVNAIIRLDTHADITAFSIAEQWWEALEPMFDAYLTGEPNARA